MSQTLYNLLRLLESDAQPWVPEAIFLDAAREWHAVPPAVAEELIARALIARVGGRVRPSGRAWDASVAAAVVALVNLPP